MSVWFLVGWLTAALAIAILERIRSLHDAGLLDPDNNSDKYLAYVLFLLFSPMAILAVLIFALIKGPRRAWKIASGIPTDPFREPEEQWLNQEPDRFVDDLVLRRMLHDARRKSTDLVNKNVCAFERTKDAMILDVVIKYYSLKNGGLKDALIWERLETHRAEHGEEVLPVNCDLGAYIDYRLTLEDPPYLEIGQTFIADQKTLCEKYAVYRMGQTKDNPWPPKAWLRNPISLAQFERVGHGIDPMAEGSPAMLMSGNKHIRSGLNDLKTLMLPGDELWSFSSPPDMWEGLIGRAGIVLMRDGHPVANVVTQKN